MSDLGLTHVALPCTNMDKTIAFYREYADMEVVHDRTGDGVRVAWLSDLTRPFVLVFLQTKTVERPLGPFAHLGVALKSREEVDARVAKARAAGLEIEGPTDSGPPVGYWVFLRDPDGHTLELAFGQEVEFTVKSAAE